MTELEFIEYNTKLDEAEKKLNKAEERWKQAVENVDLAYEKLRNAQVSGDEMSIVAASSNLKMALQEEEIAALEYKKEQKEMLSLINKTSAFLDGKKIDGLLPKEK